MQPIIIFACFGEFLPLLSSSAGEIRVQSDLNLEIDLGSRTHRDKYRCTLFASVFQRVFCVHTQAIFADDEPSEHANSFPDIRWRLM